MEGVEDHGEDRADDAQTAPIRMSDRSGMATSPPRVVTDLALRTPRSLRQPPDSVNRRASRRSAGDQLDGSVNAAAWSAGSHPGFAMGLAMARDADALKTLIVTGLVVLGGLFGGCWDSRAVRPAVQPPAQRAAPARPDR